MQKSRRWIIPSGVILLISTIVVTTVLWKETWFSPEDIAIHVVIVNRTDNRIGPFNISTHQDSTSVQINQIEPFSMVDIYYKNSESWGENAMIMTDSNGTIYPVAPYFENQQNGRIDIRIECASPNGLSGRIRHLTSEYFSMKWYPWGNSDCR